VADATAALFDELSRRGHEPLLDQAAGRVRFELFDESQTDVWLVTLNKGDIAVSREPLDADCVVRTQKTVFEAIAAGKVNAMAAVLRGALTVQGDPELLLRFQRLLPAPVRPRGAA
jgi:predicted lipid carrier protein YhbT